MKHPLLEKIADLLEVEIRIASRSNGKVLKKERIVEEGFFRFLDREFGGSCVDVSESILRLRKLCGFCE